jgi:hypothetical protein
VSNRFADVPLRVAPYMETSAPNQPILLLRGPFELTGPGSGRLEADLVFEWVPSAQVAFEGTCAIPSIDLDGDWALESREPTFSVPILISSISMMTSPTSIRGFIAKPVAFGCDSFESVRFCLVNFPDYIGEAVRLETMAGDGVVRGRIRVTCDRGECRVDEIHEAKDVVKLAKREGGFVISHVGEWLPSSGRLTSSEADSVLEMLRIWFGFVGVSWSGPVFPEGVTDGKAVWRKFGPWRLGDGKSVSTWMPQRTPLDLSDGFEGFARRWNDPTWQAPLRTAVSWLVEANAPGRAIESRVVLSQVALELLAWVFVVETERLQSRSDFKRISAAGKIRSLLQALDIPTTLPDYMAELPRLVDNDAFDGPGVVTRVRNALVHAAEDNRNTIASMDSGLWFECSQLALQYVELALLAICGHTTEYARRGWRGWKGDDEVSVPWVRPG